MKLDIPAINTVPQSIQYPELFVAGTLLFSTCFEFGYENFLIVIDYENNNLKMRWSEFKIKLFNVDKGYQTVEYLKLVTHLMGNRLEIVHNGAENV